MTEESENRLKRVMDKLYSTPCPKLSALRRLGDKKSFSTNETASSKRSLGTAPPCRPWDRGDLMRRLATFKAMTWFGKPKVISPVSCARRGWINVEMDVIVCEACGARLLFSTSQSWTLPQVEKAASVFSLKLDSGHKLLCPWINNSCDESLARFPPTPPQVLAEEFKERLNALVRLSALPVISPVAVDYMKSPQLERLLSFSFHTSITLRNGILLIDECRSMDMDDASKGVVADDYYKALKFISLCGWEPRLLPYSIDLEDGSDPSAQCISSLESWEQIDGEPKQNITSCSSSCNDGEGRNEISPVLSDRLNDPASTALDCRLCGTCVGLWSFKTIPRPLEVFKITVDNSNRSEFDTGTTHLAQNVEVPSIKTFGGTDEHPNDKRTHGLHLTIAGGPPPTRQHIRPKVSFPVVSRHLRAELASKSCFRHDQSLSKNGHRDEEEDLNQDNDDEPQAADSMKRKRSEVENYNSQTQMQGGVDDLGDVHAHSSEYASEKSLCKSPCNDGIDRDTGSCESSPATKLADAEESRDGYVASYRVDAPENNKCDPSHSASSSLTSINLSTSLGTSIKGPSFQTAEKRNASLQESLKSAKNASLSNPHEEDANHISGTLKLKLLDFDPIMQHRPFCPWSASDDSKSFPGWKATLSALDNQENSSSQRPGHSDSDSMLLDEVDDPILSVRKLFMSPPSKRMKGNN
ncbi:hypothetical protein HPP92_024407 [Vanilla planifolia]|uniref:C3HC-type domain-containing protein n=1 Tax=Vanilla planifolia TaxID=51239 RepID=A0A835PNG3_VANPL|nr:hypothetical protein HPP92_024407 [Vanilla planifolia]